MPRNKQVSTDEASQDEEHDIEISTGERSRDELQHIQSKLLKILTANLQESRYAVFEYTIKEYHKDCFDRVYKNITLQNKPNKREQLKHLETLYKTHIEDYPKQNRQAILDDQIPEPISRNAGIATNALCNQMYGFVH